MRFSCVFAVRPSEIVVRGRCNEPSASWGHLWFLWCLEMMFSGPGSNVLVGMFFSSPWAWALLDPPGPYGSPWALWVPPCALLDPLGPPLGAGAWTWGLLSLMGPPWALLGLSSDVCCCNMRSFMTLDHDSCYLLSSKKGYRILSDRAIASLASRPMLVVAP